MRVPEVAQKIRINARKYCQEVSFERANSAFGNFAAMHVRREKLDSGLPVFSDNSLEVGAEFIIHDVMVDLVATLPESLRD